MFTGIVKCLGEVVEILDFENGIKIFVKCPELSSYHLGGSIMINGACMTLVSVAKNEILEFEVIKESLRLTNLGLIKIGDKVNLEPSLTLNSLIDGHLVTGHIDFMAELVNLKDYECYFSYESAYGKYIALKGSITVNGVSLTVSGKETDYFKVSLIPKTLNDTNLGLLSLGDKVNIEIDILARYLENINKTK
jgi:riboflavin synthase